MNKKLTFVILAAALAASAPAAQADKLTLSAGGDFSSGDYGGTQDTKVWYEFVAARYWVSPVAVKVTVPFLEIDGPANVASDGELGGAGVNKMVSGVGDLSVSTTYNIAWKSQKLYLDLTGRIRLPTGDVNRGLGSGETDYGLSSSLSKDFDGFSVYVEGGRRFLGSSLANPRQDGWLAGGGISTDLSDTTEIGTSLSWREAAFKNRPDPTDVSAYARFAVMPDLKVTVNGVAGLSNGSPNYGAGLSLSWVAYHAD